GGGAGGAGATGGPRARERPAGVEPDAGARAERARRVGVELELVARDVAELVAAGRRARPRAVACVGERVGQPAAERGGTEAETVVARGRLEAERARPPARLGALDAVPARPPGVPD